MSDLASLYIRVDSSGVVTASRDLKTFEDAAQKVEGTTRKAETATNSLNGSFSKLKGAVASLATAYAALKMAQFVQDMITAQMAMERMTVALKAATGSATAAASEMAYIRAESQRLGLSLQDQAKAYTKLAAAAKGTSLEGKATREIFTAVSEAATALQLSADESAGALYAISQMISKGTVQAEELRGQLGERLPGAFQVAAKAMGVSTAELGKMLEQGKVMSDDFLPKFAKALHDHYTGAIDDASKSSSANLNRMKTAIFELKVSIGEAFGSSTLGAMQAVTTALEKMKKEMESPEAKEAIADLSAEFEKLIINAGQNAPNAIRKTLEALNGIMAFYNALPPEIVEAAGMGIIGRMLFGAGPGKIIAGITLINSALSRFDMNLGAMVNKYKDGAGAFQNVIDVIMGKKNWKTGASNARVNPFNENVMTGKGSNIPGIDVEAMINPLSLYQTSTSKFSGLQQGKGTSGTIQKTIDDIKKLAEEWEKTEQALNKEMRLSGMEGIRKDFEQNLIETEELKKKYENLPPAVRKAAYALIDEAKAQKDAGVIILATQKSREDNAKAMEKEKKEYDELAEKMATLEGSYSPIIAAQNKYLKQIKEIQAALDAGVIDESKAGKLTGLAGMEKDSTVAKGYADFYSQIEGYAQQAYEKKLKYIELERNAHLAALTEEEKQEGMTAAVIAKSYQDQMAAYTAKIDAEQKWTKTVLSNLGTALEAAKECYAEDSYEYNRINDMKKGVLAAEMLMEAAKNAAILSNMVAQNAAYEAAMAKKTAGLQLTAAEAVLTQGEGDPYTAFARMAAMMAIVASVMGAVGIAFSGSLGGGSSSSYGPTYTGKSTVLGAADDVASESVNKSYELLQDTYDMQYSELEDLNQSMTELNGNITGLVSSIIRTGNINGNFNINTDTEYPSWWVGISKSEKWTGIGIVDTMLGWIQDLGLGIMNGLFGGKTSTEIQETGIALGMTGTIRNIMDGAYNINPYEYAITKTTKDGGWFGSDSESYSAYTQAASEQVTSLFRKVFINMSSSLVELAKAFGTDVNDVMNYAFENFQINLRGMSGEEINEALSAKFSEMMDTAVSQLFGNIVEQYQQVGEGIYETAVRIVTDMASVKNILDKTNQTLPVTKTGLIDLSESLISLAGDLETLQDSFAAYYDKFFTDAEKHANLLVDLYDTMSQMNYILPASREGYRQLVESIDTTTESGQRALVALLGLASYADEYYSYLEDQTKSNLDDAKSNLDQAFDAEKERLNAAYDAELEILNTRLSDANDVVSSLTASVNKLRQARDAMNLVDEVYARGMYKYSMASLDGILGAARGGDISGVDTMDNIISILTGDNTKYYSNKIDYSRDYWKTYSALNELGDIVGDQLTDAEKQVELLESQIDILKTNHDSELAMLEAQYNVLIGINTSVMSLAEAIAAYKSAQSSSSSAATSGLSATETAINGLYQAYLGRNAEAAGLAFYSNELASGLTLSNIAYQIKNSPEYKSLHGYDLGGIASGPETGYEATLHGTELVVSPKNSYPATVKSNVVSNEEFQAMRKSLEEIKLELSKINKNTANTDNTLKTVSRGGRAFQTEAFA